MGFEPNSASVSAGEISVLLLVWGWLSLRFKPGSGQKNGEMGRSVHLEGQLVQEKRFGSQAWAESGYIVLSLDGIWPGVLGNGGSVELVCRVGLCKTIRANPKGCVLLKIFV